MSRHSVRNTGHGEDTRTKYFYYFTPMSAGGTKVPIVHIGVLGTKTKYCYCCSPRSAVGTKVPIVHVGVLVQYGRTKY